jgi:putative membrane protein
MLFVKGMVIGVANIIPGVSGGTLAVVLGIYDKLIEAISYIFSRPEKRKEYFVFLAAVFLGAGAAILLLANLMDYLLDNHYRLTVLTFMGLIAGGIPAIWQSHADMKVKIPRIAAFFVGVLLVIIPALLGSDGKEAAVAAQTGVAAIGLPGCLFLIFAGFMAGGGMIIPGVSGSFILVLMGQYSLIIEAIKEFLILPIIFVGAGAVTGIFLFSKIIEVCLEKYPSETYYFIMGLVIASLLMVFPGMPTGIPSILAGAALFIAGAGAAYFMSKIST